MDFASLKNNPLYGPLRILAGALLAFGVAKGWIKLDFIDADTMAALGVAVLTVWSIWQQNHAAKKADLTTAVAVVHTLNATGTSLSAAQQKVVAARAAADVKNLPEKQITDALNASQLSN